MDNEMMFGSLMAAMWRLPDLMDRPNEWSSLIVNRRKPWTYRAFTTFEHEGRKLRICLHRFETCDEQESFLHPHPWPGAFWILRGSYIMNVGFSSDRLSKPVPVTKIILAAGSKYAITNPMTWHSVTPLEECYTQMVNGDPWDKQVVAHTEIRTTKGKDLDSMSDEDLSAHFTEFRGLIGLGKKEVS